MSARRVWTGSASRSLALSSDLSGTITWQPERTLAGHGDSLIAFTATRACYDDEDVARAPVPQGPILGPWYRLAAVILWPPMMTITRREWLGAEHLGLTR